MEKESEMNSQEGEKKEENNSPSVTSDNVSDNGSSFEQIEGETEEKKESEEKKNENDTDSSEEGEFEEMPPLIDTIAKCLEAMSTKEETCSSDTPSEPKGGNEQSDPPRDPPPDKPVKEKRKKVHYVVVQFPSSVRCCGENKNNDREKDKENESEKKSEGDPNNFDFANGCLICESKCPETIPKGGVLRAPPIFTTFCRVLQVAAT